MDENSGKRLRTAVACDKCKSLKKRCEGGSPCNYCSRRNLLCRVSPRAADEGATHEEEDEPQSLRTGYHVDFPPVMHGLVFSLLDRYFDVIAPLWPVVDRSDLNAEPFASPLLVRAVCLVSAMSLRSASHTQSQHLVSSIVDSVQQCFASRDLMARPSVSTLQAILLMLTCPAFSQRPIMVTMACRMCLILGYHRAQASRPVLYWSAIMWARLEVFQSMDPDSDLCFDLQCSYPATEPDASSFLGQVYHLLADMECLSSVQERGGSIGQTPAMNSVQQHCPASGMGSKQPRSWSDIAVSLMWMCVMNMRASLREVISEAKRGDHAFLGFEPFCSLIKYMESQGN